MSLDKKIKKYANENNLYVSFLEVSNFFPFNCGVSPKGNLNYYFIKTSKDSHYDFICIGEDGSYLCSGKERVREGGTTDIGDVSSVLKKLYKELGLKNDHR
jgi:hypothetical protein